MNDSEMLRMIRQEVRREMNIILSGAAGNNSSVINEDIQQMYPGMATIESRPVMHPYGFASRAPEGTIQVVAKQGEHTGNRVVLGHRASDRPTTINEGETAVYSVGTYIIIVRKNKIEMGKGGTLETVVMGESLTKLLGEILDAIASHTHVSSGAPPTNQAAFTGFKTANIDNGKLLAKDGGKF